MADSAAVVYAQEIREHLKRYVAWLPDETVELGSVGRLSDGIFEKETNLAHFKIKWNAIPKHDGASSFSFASKGTKRNSGNVSVGGVPVQGVQAGGTLDIGFTHERSVFVQLENCTHLAIEDTYDLGERILKLVEKEEWPLDFVVVTAVVAVGSATIIQSSGETASIKLKAKASTSISDALKIAGGVESSAESNIGFNMVTKAAPTPLCSLHKVKYSFWRPRFLGGTPSFKPERLKTFAVEPSGRLRASTVSSIVRDLPYVDMYPSKSRTGNIALKLQLNKKDDLVDLYPILDLADITTSSTEPCASATFSFEEI